MHAVSWSEFESNAPEVARAGQRLLEDAPGTPGLAFLATVGSDRRPRMHPFVPAVVGGGLWAFVILSPKQRDLDRDGWYAMHSRPARDDESFFAAGRAVRVDDDHVRIAIAECMPYSNIDELHILYELRIDRALWTTWTTPTQPVHRKWKRADT